MEEEEVEDGGNPQGPEELQVVRDFIDGQYSSVVVYLSSLSIQIDII